MDLLYGSKTNQKTKTKTTTLTMTTQFTLDDREHALRVAFEQRIQGRDDVRMECRRLDMGDIVIHSERTQSILHRPWW